MRAMCWTRIVAAVVALGVAGAVRAEAKGLETDFQRGYFLQTHEKNPEAAAKAFEKFLSAAEKSDPLRAEAARRLAECREDVASVDLARLMPPETVVYVELRNPGQHIDRLLKMTGLVRDPGQKAPASKGEAIPLGNGLFLPEDFAVSPALVAELGKIKGVAAALTSLDRRGDPVGVVVIHPGDCDLLRGLVETVVQILQPGDPIEGFKTYRLEDAVSVAVTNRLAIIARRREDLAAVIGRLRNPQAKGLASHDGLRQVQPERDNALLFAYVDGQRAAKQFAPMLRGNEGVLIKTLLDLDHLQALTAAVRTTEDGLQVRARLDLMEGHHNLAYGLIRTAPLSMRSLDGVPASAAAVAMLGLNPPTKPAASQPVAAAQSYYLTGMDIGRELFSNIEEIAVFALPVSPAEQGKRSPIPPVAAIITANDPAKSEALWNQLLALPAALGLRGTQPARPITIENLRGTEFSFPEMPPIVLVRAEDRAVVVGTRAAVTAAIQAFRSNENVRQDPGFKPLVDRLTPDSSKAILVHAGRTLMAASRLARGREAKELALAGSLCGNLTLSLITHEKPTQLIVQIDATGLPDVSEIIRAIAQQTPGSRNRVVSGGP